MDSFERTIPAAVFEAAARHADRPAIVSGGEVITYEGLLDRALRAAAVLAGHGVSRGDRVAILLPNSAAWIEAALGAAFAGAVIVPISTRLKAQEAAFILRKSRARALIAASDFLGTDYAAMADGLDLPDLQMRIRSSLQRDAGDEWARALATVDDHAVARARADARQVGENDLAEFIFTSGTTGFPKGAMLRQGQVVRVYGSWAKGIGIRAGDRYLIIAPMFHSFGFKAGVIASILAGATMYPVGTFDVEKSLEMIEAQRITVMGGPPTIFSSLLEANAAAGRDISSLRSVAMGGGMISPDLVRALQQEVGVETVVNAYGLTECSALATMSSPDDPVELIATTAGKVIEGVEIRCVDADEVTVAAGEAGEIQVRGHNVMAGYFEDKEGTAKAFTADGWLKTGDVGIIDAAGYLRVTDRLKDMFIVGGFNCYPAEIERIMLAYPGIREVAVVGTPDARMGEVARAFVVPQEGAGFDVAAFIAWCRDNMANYKVPRSVETLASLPRNAMGKVQKFLLRGDA